MKYSIQIMSHENHDLLHRCLNNIKAYTPFEYEIVISDDASSYSYEPLVKGMFKHYTIVELPKRSDCCTLRNVGMAMCKTPFVFWVDNDCLVGENWWREMVELIESNKKIGLVGSPHESRLIRNPFLPLTQRECMVEYQFAYDFNHYTNTCDFLQSPCCLMRKSAYRPTYCYDMPTPVLDPDLGAWVKLQGYKVMVTKNRVPYDHLGSQTERPHGEEYKHHLAENFTKWWEFWYPYREKVFELYSGKPVKYDHDAMEKNRAASMGNHGNFDIDNYHIVGEDD